MKGLCIHPWPWSFRPSKIRKGQLIAAAQIVDKDGDIIAKVNAGNTAVMDDVARLMATAPDLLEALNSLYDLALSGDPIPHNSSHMQAAMRAIIKAKGENS